MLIIIGFGIAQDPDWKAIFTFIHKMKDKQFVTFSIKNVIFDFFILLILLKLEEFQKVESTLLINKRPLKTIHSYDDAGGGIFKYIGDDKSFLEMFPFV